MTDKLLKGLAAQAFNMIKRDLERGNANMLLASYHEGEGLRRQTKVERMICGTLGEDWLNSGATKDMGFEVIRLGVSIAPPDAIVIATLINKFAPTAKVKDLPAEQWEKINHSHDNQHQAVKDGYLTVCDALFVIAQTPERVCLYSQGFDRRGRPDGAPEVVFGPQDEFDGRLKMFGDGKYASSR